MAVIHHTTLKPTKVELLAGWLPTRPWYRGGPDPVLEKSGGFRLDDPEGEVGIEFMVATDTTDPERTAYLVPLTYRGAPLDGAEHALVGTTEHGVLGTRWVYDGCHDPVLTDELLSLIAGRAQAMAQSVSDTPDHEVTRSHTGSGEIPAGFTPEPADDRDGTRLPVPDGTVLRIHRVLSPVADNPPPAPRGALGHVAGGWPGADDGRLRAVFVTLRPA
ncbi:1,4-alpha-glucan branching protein [Streptomyces sp. 5-8]|uniref:1,4-alpha-glucan branching protein n=1 Tax=Streptomyces musisoli TaxID=2802280 RepID=A0ABS1P829_9ACTN|nr:MULTISPECIES: 1,4-alpha-glucan branching protein [Streptomyces]MBL1108531.1 1,4-alpha-glucan branching protein [Streptomyces musisoli]MBY8841261.1 1,4-alpha-glucan branching protein [Streptomyces sp. SP2-10]